MRHFIYAVLFIGFPAAAIVGLFFDSVSPEITEPSIYGGTPAYEKNDTSRTTQPQLNEPPFTRVIR